MASAKFDIPAGIVVHPVYGAGPTVSGIAVPMDAIRRGARLYGDEEFYPCSVLIADTSRQNFSLYPKKYYVDVLNECLTCGAPFVFFAQEQKHWYETLGFVLDADCVRCVECRSRGHDHGLCHGRDLICRVLAGFLLDHIGFFEDYCWWSIGPL